MDWSKSFGRGDVLELGYRLVSLRADVVLQSRGKRLSTKDPAARHKTVNWDGAGRRVWQRLMRASYDIRDGPRRAHLRSTSPIFLVSVGEGKVHEAVAVVVE